MTSLFCNLLIKRAPPLEASQSSWAAKDGRFHLRTVMLPEQYSWSSYRAHIGLVECKRLDVDPCTSVLLDLKLVARRFIGDLSSKASTSMNWSSSEALCSAIS
jgi:hypothetical protein